MAQSTRYKAFETKNLGPQRFYQRASLKALKKWSLSIFGGLPCLDTHSCWTAGYRSKLDTQKFCQFPNPDDQNDWKSVVIPRS